MTHTSGKINLELFFQTLIVFVCWKDTSPQWRVFDSRYCRFLKDREVVFRLYPSILFSHLSALARFIPLCTKIFFRQLCTCGNDLQASCDSHRPLLTALQILSRLRCSQYKIDVQAWSTGQIRLQCDCGHCQINAIVLPDIFYSTRTAHTADPRMQCGSFVASTSGTTPPLLSTVFTSNSGGTVPPLPRKWQNRQETGSCV